MTTDLLDRLAAAPAGRVAVISGDTRLTFAELRDRVARVAAGLTARGIGPESVVGLCLPRGADLVVALLGTLAAGAAYLPIDPRMPAGRRRLLAEDAGAALVVTEVAGLAAEGTFAPVPVDPGALAYVIYTSGSTGRPKGVEISRGAAARLLAELEETGVVRPGHGTVGWNASPSFDASVQQWVRVCRGDTLVLLDEATRADPVLFAAAIRDHRLTDLDITPSHAEPLLEHLGTDREQPLTLLVGGEPISPELWDRLAGLADAGVLRPVNVYGPTECTVDATAAWITAGTAPHIGGALPGLTARLLDDALRPVADGEVGELYLSGPRVGRGYRARPGLTAGRVVADPAGDGTRMYRTGDRCRRRTGGELEFLGRADGQVKVRGHRIELGEIEAAVRAHPAVAEAAVAVHRDDLVAYYRQSAPADPAELRELVAAALPGYMVPATFVAVSRFPRTTSGKLDRAALPAPAPTAPEVVADAPTGHVEQLIAGVWSEVLRRPAIGADDNFFKLGGHSLLAIKLVARVRTELGFGLPVKSVYENPRLRDLARAIEAGLESSGAR